MRWLPALTLAAAVGCAAPLPVVAQQQASESQEADTDIWIRPSGSDPKRCNFKVATKVTLASLAADPARWKSKCIAVQGYWNGSMLLADKTDRKGIAIYTNRRLSRMAPRAPRLYVAAGIASRCTDLPQNVMVMGYCHTSDGPYIAVAQMRPR